jgi:flagellar biosynthesis GTPase FlhF
MNVIQQMTISNFDSMLEDPSSIPKDPTVVTMTRKRKSKGPKGSCAYPKHVAEDLQKHLVHSFEVFYLDHLGPKAEFPPAVFFGHEEAVALVGSIDQICAGDTNDVKLMERLIGGQCFDGQMASLDQAITDWTKSDYYQQHLHIVTDLDRFIESEGIRVRMEMAAGFLALQEAAASRRQAEKDAKATAKAQAKTQAAAARTTARLLRASDLALEQARLQSEKAAQKKAKEEERLANLQCQAQARAVTKAAQTAQRAAEKASREAIRGQKQRIGPQDRAGKKTARQVRLAQNLAKRHESLGAHKRPVDMISQDTTMGNDTSYEGEPDVPGDNESFRGAIGPAGNIEDIENHTRAARIARTESIRQKNQANLKGAKGHWVEPPTIRHTRSRGQARSHPNVSTVLHSQVTASGMEGVRAELQSGGVQGLGNSPFHISSEELSLTS